MVPDTKAAPFPELMWGVIVTACVIFSFFPYNIRANITPSPPSLQRDSQIDCPKIDHLHHTRIQMQGKLPFHAHPPRSTMTVPETPSPPPTASIAAAPFHVSPYQARV